MWCINPLCLQQYLQDRGFHLRQTKKTRTARRLFKRAVRQDRLPLTLDQWGEYRQRPQYYSTTPFTPVADTLKQDQASVVKLLKTMSVSKESIHESFAAPNEVYKRALRRLCDEHIDISSLSVVSAISNETQEPLQVLTTQVAASLRNKVHVARLSCTVSGEVLPAPYSSCSCEVR